MSIVCWIRRQQCVPFKTKCTISFGVLAEFSHFSNLCHCYEKNLVFSVIFYSLGRVLNIFFFLSHRDYSIPIRTKDPCQTSCSVLSIFLSCLSILFFSFEQATICPSRKDFLFHKHSCPVKLFSFFCNALCSTVRLPICVPVVMHCR